MNEIRWYRCPSSFTRFPLPNPGDQITFVAVADVLAYLDDPERLRDSLEMLLATGEPVPDTIPDDFAEGAAG